MRVGVKGRNESSEVSVADSVPARDRDVTMQRFVTLISDAIE